MQPQNELRLSSPVRIGLLAAAVVGLIMVFLFQQSDFLGWLISKEQHPYVYFSFNRGVRLLLNDLLMLALLAAWFNSRSVLKLAVVVQLIDFLVLLPLYLIVKLTVEGDLEISSPLLSQFHRLIVNPTLMILLIPAVYFQRYKKVA